MGRGWCARVGCVVGAVVLLAALCCEAQDSCDIFTEDCGAWFFDEDCREGFVRGNLTLWRRSNVQEFLVFFGTADNKAVGRPVLLVSVAGVPSSINPITTTVDASVVLNPFLNATGGVDPDNALFMPENATKFLVYNAANETLGDGSSTVLYDSQESVDEFTPPSAPAFVTFQDFNLSRLAISGSGAIGASPIELSSEFYTVGYRVRWCRSEVANANDANCVEDDNVGVIAATGAASYDLSIEDFSLPSPYVYLSPRAVRGQCVLAGGPGLWVDQECGNGVKTSSESCDDGNLQSNDGCSSTCETERGWECARLEGPNTACVEVCGDGNATITEECDFGANTAACVDCVVQDGYSCFKTLDLLTVCNRCGNGDRSSSEQCDDGNEADGDGCSSNCQLETSYYCVESQAQQSVCRPYFDSMEVVSLLIRLSGGIRRVDFDESGAFYRFGLAVNQVTSGVATVEVGITVVADISIEVTQVAFFLIADASTAQKTAGGDAANAVTSAVADGTLAQALQDHGFSVDSDGVAVPAGALPIVTNGFGEACGDGVKGVAEECDDANRNGGDGCSAQCAVELGWQCSTVAGAASVCEQSDTSGVLPCADPCTLVQSVCVCPQGSDGALGVWPVLVFVAAALALWVG